MRVLKVKMSPDSEQVPKLLEIMRQFNAACNWISGIAFEQKAFRQVPLHAACYHAVREQFRLPAQLAVRAIGKVLETYRRDKSIAHVYGHYSAAVYDERVFRLEGVTYASMTLLQGRERIRLDCGSYQRKHLAGTPNIGQVDLLYENGQFTLALSLRFPDPPKRETKGVLGVDLGITEIATDSEGNQYSGTDVKACRRRYREFRRGLQSCGKKGAKRRLKAISRKQSRFVRHTNHCISKHLIATASEAGKALALEDLTGIRGRTSNGFAATTRWLLGNWAFFQLRQFVEYKATDAGLTVTLVDPKNTSRTCSCCGHCEKSNRKSQASFLCLECGFQINADFNAACNIAVKGLETRATCNLA